MTITWKCPWCQGDNLYTGTDEGDKSGASCQCCGLPLGDVAVREGQCAVFVAPGLRCSREGTDPWVEPWVEDHAHICAEHAVALAEIRSAAAEARKQRARVPAAQRVRLLRPGSATKEIIEDIQRRHSAAGDVWPNVSAELVGTDVRKIIDLTAEQERLELEDTQRRRWAERVTQRREAERRQVAEWERAEEERLAAERAEERHLAMERSMRAIGDRAERERSVAGQTTRPPLQRTMEERRLAAIIARRRWAEKRAWRQNDPPTK